LTSKPKIASQKSSPQGGVEIQIPRNALALLMVAQAMVVLPHSQTLSPWIMAVCVVCGIWRWMVFQGRWDFPRRWLKAMLVVGSVAAVAMSGSSAFSLETATSLLILAFALKLVEMKGRRDAYLVIFLGYFIIATEFLFSQNISMAAYELFAAIMVTAAMVGMNQMHAQVRPIASLKLASALILQALPLMLVLFLFFPRIAPLWSIPLPGGAKTGISDTVTPGDIAKLSRSAEVAFRVEFSSQIPPTSQLYWRGLVYSRFENGSWTQAPPPTFGGRNSRLKSSSLFSWGDKIPEFLPELENTKIKPIAYEVLLQPTQSNWLFGLQIPTIVSEKNDIALTRDYRLMARERVSALLRYEVESFSDLPVDRVLPDWIRTRETTLPPADNPRIIQFAQRLFAESDGVEDFARKIMAQIRSEPYRYTLAPPGLPRRNSIDVFWFETQAGFCSHYAGAFVYMMRAAGIPARMVGGYQGGDLNPLGQYLVVRQMDAHAWTEVWIKGKGWVRYDPTNAVAPERIEQGLDAALSTEDLGILSVFTTARLSNFAGIADLVYMFDSIGHTWNLWVVGYDPNVQAAYLKKLLGDVTPGKRALVLLIGVALSMSLVVIALFWRRRKVRLHPVVRIFLKFSKSIERFGFIRQANESPARFVSRIDIRRTALVEQLDQLLYNSASVSSSQLTLLRKRLRKLQVSVALGLTKEIETAG